MSHIPLRAAFTGFTTAALVALPLLHFSPAAGAQQLVPSSHGFTFGSSIGSSSFYRQENRSEASALQQLLTTNASPLAPGSDRFTIDNPRESFNVIDVRQSQSASDTQTTVGGTAISGSNFSVFSN